MVPKPTRPQGASKARHSLRAPNMSLDRGRVSVCVTTRPGRVRVGTPAELQATPSVRNTARASWAWPVTMPPSTPGALGWTGHGGFHGAMLQPSCLPVPTDPSQGGWALTSWVRKPREEEAQMLSSDELVCWSRSAGPTVAKRQGVLRPGDTQVSSALGTRPEPGALRGCREQLLRPVPSAGGGVSARAKARLSRRPPAQPLSTLWDSAHYSSSGPRACPHVLYLPPQASGSRLVTHPGLPHRAQPPEDVARLGALRVPATEPQPHQVWEPRAPSTHTLSWPLLSPPSSRTPSLG